MRAVAERVAPEIEVEAWVLDDTGFPKDGKALAGGQAPVLGDAGQDRQLPDRRVAARGRQRGGTVPLGWALYLPEEWCADPQRRAQGQDPRARWSFRPSPSWASSWSCAPPAGRSRRRRSSAICAYGNNTALRDTPRRRRARVRAVGRARRRRCSRPRRPSRCPTATQGRAAQPAAAGPRTRVDRRADRARRGAHAPRPSRFRDGPDGTAAHVALRRSCACAPHTTGTPYDQRWRQGRRGPPREEWLIAEWPDGHDEPTDYWISNLPADTDARAARAAGAAALEDRARLQAAQGRARPRPLRRPLLARLVPPHRAGHRRPRLSHPRAAEPKSPAAGLTLPKAVLLLQPIFKCWTGRCQTCQRPIDLARLPLPLSRRDE